MEMRRKATGLLKFIIVAGVILVLSAGTVAVSGKSNIKPAEVLAVPDWTQVNSDGFGDATTDEVTAVESFNGYLYAGTHNTVDPEPLYDGAQIFRSSDGTTWNPVIEKGFGNSHDIAPPAILDFVIFNNYLYASTGRGNASQIWRSSNGTIWAPMDVTGFSDPDNVDITVLAVYGSKIYAGVTNSVSGVQVWTSFTGDNNSWTQMTTPELVDSHITGFGEFDGGLYAAVESESPAQIWVSHGSDWTTVISDGFGSETTTLTGGMAVFGGYLYAGAGDKNNGAMIYRTNDGTTWSPAISPGFGNANNLQVELLFVFQNQLYAGTQNTTTGLELWRTSDGTLWEQANQDGFGDSNNTSTNRSNAAAVFLGKPYVGTLNGVTGGEIWHMNLPQMFLYLPISLRQP